MELSLSVHWRAAVNVRIRIFAQQKVLEIPKISVFKYHRTETWRDNNSAKRSNTIVSQLLEHFDFTPELVNLLRIGAGGERLNSRVSILLLSKVAYLCGDRMCWSVKQVWRNFGQVDRPIKCFAQFLSAVNRAGGELRKWNPPGHAQSIAQISRLLIILNLVLMNVLILSNLLLEDFRRLSIINIAEMVAFRGGFWISLTTSDPGNH